MLGRRREVDWQQRVKGAGGARPPRPRSAFRTRQRETRVRHVRRAVIGAAAAYDDGVGRFGVEADIIVLRWVGRGARGGGSSDGLGWARMVEEWAERAAAKAV